MKRKFLYLTTALFVFCAGLMITGCDEDTDKGVLKDLYVKSYTPEKVIEGTKMYITGIKLDDATEVIFPGNKAATDITLYSNTMISVIVPAGVSTEGGDLIVKSPTQTAKASTSLKVANPKCTSLTPGDRIFSGDEFTIAGADLEFFDKAIFPGEDKDIVINGTAFKKQEINSLSLIVPEGVKEGPVRIKLQTAAGVELLLPEVEFLSGIQLRVTAISPTKLIEGLEVEISGTGLDVATEVIFPGNKSVTTINVISGNKISVIVPKGVGAGEMIVKTPNQTLTANIPLTVASPSCTAITPNKDISSGVEITITGVDLEYFDKAIFPGKIGDAVVKAAAFLEHTSGILRLKAPVGLINGSGRIKLQTAGGIELLLPEVSFVSKGEWLWQETTVWEGNVAVSWGGGLTFQGSWFTKENLKLGDIVRCFIITSGGWPQIKFYTGGWGGISLRDDMDDNGCIANRNHFTVNGDITYLDFPMNENLLNRFTSSSNILATGDGITFTRVIIYRQVWVE